MNLTELIPLLNSYPLWARIVVLICAAIIVSVLVLAREVKQESKQGTSSQSLQHGSIVENQNAATINNVFQGVPQTLSPSTKPLLSPAQERLLGLLTNYQTQYAAYKLVISRTDGRLVFDGDPKRGEDVSLIRDLFGSTDSVNQAEFVKLVDTMPPEYLRVYPEMRWDSPFVVGVTDAGLSYLNRQAPTIRADKPHTSDPH
jgi:hypothetical protein